MVSSAHFLRAGFVSITALTRSRISSPRKDFGPVLYTESQNCTMYLRSAMVGESVPARNALPCRASCTSPQLQNSSYMAKHDAACSSVGPSPPPMAFVMFARV